MRLSTILFLAALSLALYGGRDPDGAAKLIDQCTAQVRALLPW